MDEIRDLTLGIPADTSVLGIFYIREIEKDGYLYNSADSKVFMIPGVDGIDVVTGKTYSIVDGEWQEYVSPVQLSDEEIESREQLEKDLVENIEENNEGAPSTDASAEE